MTTQDAAEKKPLWLLIEEKIFEVGPQELEGQNQEQAIQKIVQDLDAAGHNVSQNGGNLLEVRWAIKDMLKVKRPLMKDFNDAVGALELDDVAELIDARLAEVEESVDTLGGLAFVLAEQVPPVGTIVDHPSGWRIEVTEGDETHVTRLRLHAPQESLEED